MAEILVLGAGMVGVGSALALQSRGHDVTLLDRRAPGEETSFGNAGVIQAEARAPYALPRSIGALTRYALGQSNDVTYDLRALIRMAPALWRYFHNSAPARHAEIAQVYAQMIARVCTDHGTLIQDAGADHLLRQTGLGEVYLTQKGFDTRVAEAQTFAKTYGLNLQIRDGATQKQDEPAMRQQPAGALLWADSQSISDPGALVTAYARLFTQRGGQVIQAAARNLVQTRGGWQIETQSQTCQAEHVVIALGPWSPEFLRPLGYRIPMIYKRGYHSHFQMTHSLRRPYLLADHGVVLSSMQQGLRITSGAHLASLNAAAKPKQLQHGAAAAAQVFAIGAEIPHSQWHGTRPCLPDMLPKIGPAPEHSGLWFNFGHGHQGFTLGPTCGELLAEMIGGQDSALIRALSP